MAETTAEFLTDQYNKAMSAVGSNETITSNINEVEKALLNTILQFSE